MSDVPRREASEGYDPYLKGTTYRVYRLMLKQRKPVGISDLQRALGLSSPSVSEYHVKKLLRLGLIREEQGGYVIEKVVFDNIIRIRSANSVRFILQRISSNASDISESSGRDRLHVFLGSRSQQRCFGHFALRND